MDKSLRRPEVLFWLLGELFLGGTLLPGAMLSGLLVGMGEKLIGPLPFCQNTGFGLFSTCPLLEAVEGL